ncbi:MAG TPA: STAS domain-containing protein [Candidatus Limnocylindrales bacterium]|nr:STAS domain-containing protein [Candidatus Limnocylindrales bacterium]
MAMQTTVERVEGRVSVTVLALSGELDASNYLRLVDDVRPLYDSGARALLLDLAELSFISSSGLVSLYSILKVMQGQEPPDPEYGWSALHSMEQDTDDGATQEVVRLCALQPAVAGVLQRTGLEAMFPSYPDRETALAAF